jgi:hypothetical protein
MSWGGEGGTAPALLDGMKIRNVHEREVTREGAAVIDTLAGEDDRLWPADWPPMKLDRPLGVGAKGGHGPVRYQVIEYEPKKKIVFEFDQSGALSEGFVGTHRFDVIEGESGVRLRHAIEMDASLAAAIRWYAMVEPLHDALVEDAFDRAEGVERSKWSWRVRILRWFAIRRYSVQYSGGDALDGSHPRGVHR